MKTIRAVRRALTGAAVTGLALTMMSAAPANAEVSFAEELAPIIQIRCLACHEPGGAGFESSGFDMRTYEGIMKGTKFGPMVVANDAASSNLLTLIEGRAEIQMPHEKKPLSKCEKLLFRQWIQQGAKDN